MYKIRSSVLLSILAFMFVVTNASYGVAPAHAQGESRFFSETGHTVSGRFLSYWLQNGGLAQQGFPITEEMREISPTDGKAYTVQYFERAVFELHPENQAPYDVLLSLLGVFEYKHKFPTGAPGQIPDSGPDSIFFPQTGKWLSGKFLEYWQQHGGLAQQGYPLTDEIVATSDLNGKAYKMQYFERAVFELHPENAGTPYEVLLSQLGTFRFRALFINPAPLKPIAITKVQRDPRVSSQYIVWNEATRPLGSFDLLPRTGEIEGMDLKTKRFFSVSNDAPGDQWVQDISGSIIVWTDNRQNCPGCYEYDVRAKDLATGVEYTVATGPADQIQPVIAGRSVAWVENAGESHRLLVKDLDSPAVTEITNTAGITNIYITNPKISDEYIVWSEITPGERGPSRYGTPPHRKSAIRAFDRQSGAVSTVISFYMDWYGESLPDYTLADHRVVLSHLGVPSNPNAPNDPRAQPNLVDLRTGQFTPINLDAMPVEGREMLAPFLGGDMLVWGAYGDRGEGPDIWGINLNGGKAVPLVIGPGQESNAVFAGDTLTWMDSGGPNDGLISATSLSEAFATSTDRRKVLDAMPLPPIYSSPPTSYHAISMISASEGWAVGESGLMAHYTNGKWETTVSQIPAHLEDVQMQSPTEGWIASTQGPVHYSGGKWELVPNPSPHQGTLFSIDFVSANEGWAVGAGELLHFVNGAWQSLPDLGEQPDRDILSSVSMVSPDEGWAVGNYSVIWHYSGGKWQRFKQPTNSSLLSVAMVSANEGWASGESGVLLHYQNGKWDQAPNPSGVTVMSFHMFPNGEGWAVGRGGGILHYTGGTWNLVDTQIRGIDVLLDIDMVSPAEGWAVGNTNAILHYTGGKWEVYSR